MEKSFADRLMQRPIEHRYIKCPSPRGTKMVAGVLADCDDDYGTVFIDGYRPYIVLLEKINYR